tara:strand:- start:19 stop:300 length:282 start_codon:yes stop_codon:yes gene_type:complete
MRKIDHIALQVKDIQESITWYVDNFECEIIYQDESWAFLQFENIKLALVIKDQHPYHIAFEVDEMENGKKHRDNSISKYINDPSGNKVELIKY